MSLQCVVVFVVVVVGSGVDSVLAVLLVDVAAIVMELVTLLVDSD